MIHFYRQNVADKWRHYKRYLRPIYESTMIKTQQTPDQEVSVILVDDVEIQRLNQMYRQLNQATDVLSFVDEDSTYLGDIFISVDAITRQASDYNHSIKREFCFLVTHGLLHLLGYDHETSDQRVNMFNLQEEILDGIARRKKTEV
ncbi:MAG TPA: rRNA maturation RNase YbeY [Erysipelothrix sp.]|nr:rRNA maturation RNase YbeY [Erysipelothrix sp.]